MDSHRKVVEGILSNRYWTLNDARKLYLDHLAPAFAA